MKKLVLITVFLGLCSISYAGEQEITPRYFDLTPNDGFLDAGTPSNPYIIKDQYGREKGTIKPRYFDLIPGDGLMDAGTPANPYIIKTPEPNNFNRYQRKSY